MFIIGEVVLFRRLATLSCHKSVTHGRSLSQRSERAIIDRQQGQKGHHAQSIIRPLPIAFLFALLPFCIKAPGDGSPPRAGRYSAFFLA